MNIRNLINDFQGVSSILVLAPLTPKGNQDHIELVASALPEIENLAAVTYTQPPEQWFADWKQTVGPIPPKSRFIHASGMAQSQSFGEHTPANVDTTVVDPADPMEIIVPLSNHLKDRTESKSRAVISIQTLTVLLEYVDFDTAFRYLHILTHRIQAAGAVGFFQMDPDIHDPETINTLKTLFDVVIEVTEEGAESRSSEAYTSTNQVAEDNQSVETDSEKQPEKTNPFLGLWKSLSKLFTWNNNDDVVVHQEIDSEVDASDDPVENTPQSTVDNLVDEDMLTDEERIRSLLIHYGGRMKQADITAETSWSKSTVSRKLSKMEENEEITRVQMGRGNLVFLNGSEPEASKSPFEA
ncbi:DUF7504 family protein [Haladaptatus caseinilyticus]|uniref:DUF7504 family protein n=1 Tax=Haladaptatus caseinilyticus TaxID=2993314 RepID=UPI00224ABB0C|nr:MarR family transcriptional regulator [Haladaptatus caseinilyticus]